MNITKRSLPLSYIRNIYVFCEENDIDPRPIAESIVAGDLDFESDCGDWRFIHSEHIDSVLTDELEADEYMLGCFRPGFLQEVTGLDQELIEAIQAGEQFDRLGKWIAENHLEDLVDLYVAYDGYGNHFGLYDGEEHEVGDFYAFRIG